MDQRLQALMNWLRSGLAWVATTVASLLNGPLGMPTAAGINTLPQGQGCLAALDLVQAVCFVVPVVLLALRQAARTVPPRKPLASASLAVAGRRSNRARS